MSELQMPPRADYDSDDERGLTLFWVQNCLDTGLISSEVREGVEVMPEINRLAGCNELVYRTLMRHINAGERDLESEIRAETIAGAAELNERMVYLPSIDITVPLEDGKTKRRQKTSIAKFVVDQDGMLCVIDSEGRMHTAGDCEMVPKKEDDEY